MKTALGVLALVAFFAMSSAPASTSDTAPHPAPGKKFVQVAATCFLKGEQTSGFNKICYYRCLSGTVAITVGSLEFCPMSINR